MGLAERWDAPLGESLSPSLGRRGMRPAVEGCMANPVQQLQVQQEQATRAAKAAAFLRSATLAQIRPLPGAGPIRR
jgi:hypothetical protein